MRLVCATIALALMATANFRAYATDASTVPPPSFSYSLFEGQFGVHGHRAGLLITSGDIGPLVGDNGSVPTKKSGDQVEVGDLIEAISHSGRQLGPTLNPRRLEEFLNEASPSAPVGFVVLKAKERREVKAFRVAPDSEVSREASSGSSVGTAAAVVGGIILLGILSSPKKDEKGCYTKTETVQTFGTFDTGICPSPSDRYLGGLCYRDTEVCD